MKKLRLGFIGCGGITRQHLQHGLAKFENVEFAGWCDVNLAAAQELAQLHGGKAFDQVEKMLDEAKPEAAYIMLPPFAHGPAERAVLARKLPFFVEKPIHLNYAEAKEFAATIRREKIITSVGYMNRYRKGIQRVKALLDQQPLIMLNGGWLGGGPGSYEGIWKWWVQKDKSGGQLLEQTTHTTDLALYLGGPISEVFAVPIKSGIKRPDFYTIEEASTVLCTYEKSGTAVLSSSVSTRVGGGVHLNAWGTDFKAEFQEWAHDLSLELPGKEKIQIPGEDNIFSLEDHAFVEAVLQKKPELILADYEDGLAAAGIAEAANRSFASGQPVKTVSL